MRFPTVALPAAALALVAAGLASAASEDGGPSPASGSSQLVTLYAGDPVTHALNLADGSFGGSIDGLRFVETPAHLDYGTYMADTLTLALGDDDRGHAVDLGHWADIAKTLGFEEAIGGGVGFASLHFADADVRIARRVPKDGFQDFRDARPILTAQAGTHLLRIPPAVGHIYLLRVEGVHRRGTPLFVKMQVVAHEPGERVTLRWAPLPGK